MLDEKTRAWLTAEQEAASAELELAKLGQAAADPRVGELVLRAKRLREEADRLFREIPRGQGNQG